MATFVPTLIVLTVSFFLCVSGIQIQDGQCSYRKWEEPGNVKLLLIGGVYGNKAGQCTTQASREGVPQILAFDWLIRVLNGNNSRNQPFIPNLRIGYDMYENCDNEDLTTDLLYSGQQMLNCSSQQTAPNIYAAAISLTSPAATGIMSRLIASLPVVRPSPSSPLLEDIQNLVQTVPSFKLEVQAMVEMMSHMKWNYIALINEDTADGRAKATEFTDKAKMKNICVKFKYTLDTGMGNMRRSAENMTNDLFKQISSAYDLSLVIVYMGQETGATHAVNASKSQTRRSGSKLTWIFPSSIGNNAEVKKMFLQKKQDGDLMLSLNHPTESFSEVNAYYQSILNGTLDAPIMNDIAISYRDTFEGNVLAADHSENMINAVLGIAAALKGVWENTCQRNGLDINSCTSLKTALESQMLDGMKGGVNMSSVFAPHFLPQVYQDQDKWLRFDDDGTLIDGSLDMKLFTPATETEETLFRYTGNSLPDINVVLPTSACAKETVCMECREQIDLRYSYLPGDYLILGLFSLRVYEEGSYRCDALRRGTNDIITISAFMESIISKRAETGVNYGGIAIDDCYSPYNTSHYLIGLFSKTMTLLDHSSGTTIDFDKVFSIIGALSSSVSLVIGDIATSLQIPMISYAASSPDLDNRDRYPYFLRTVPSDILQVKGIINLIKHLNVTRVGLIYIDDSYGKSGLKNLLAEAAENHICIDNPLNVSQDMTDQELDDVRKALYEQQIGIVIYFSIDSIAQRLLQKIYDKNVNSRPIVFIASEAWGTSLDLIDENLGEVSKGSLVFNIAALKYPNTDFRTFLQNLNSTQTDQNRWIPNYFEKLNNCDFIDSFEKHYSNICDDQSRTRLDQATIDSLYLDQRGIHVMNSVHIVTEGYKQLCPGKSPLACSRQNPEEFVNLIDNVMIGNTTAFTPERNGNIGMTIYNIRRVPANPKYTFKYEKIGEFSKDGVLVINKSPRFYDELKQEKTSIWDIDESMSTLIDCNKFKGSCSRVCLEPTTPTSGTTTPLPVTEPPINDDSLMRGLTIAFGALAGIMAVALILLIVLLFRRHDTERHSSSGKSSTEGTSFDAGNTSVYDEPGTINYGLSRSENNLKTGSFLSLQDTAPTQYAHIQPSPVPIHHKRHRSNQELISHHTALHDRPDSPMSAPIPNLQPFPTTRQVAPVNKRSPRISHSPHSTGNTNSPRSMPRGTEHYKKRMNSSPKFRYPSSYNSMPRVGIKVSSVDDSPVMRRQTLVSDDYERNSVFTDDPGHDPSFHHSDSYLYPQTSTGNNSGADKPTITYLTAKDFVRMDSEDEDENDDSVNYAYDNGANNRVNKGVNKTKALFTNSAQSTPDSDTHNHHQAMQHGYDPSLISPSDKEIMAINLSDSNKVEFSKKPKHNEREATSVGGPVDKNDDAGLQSSSSGGFPSSPSRSNQPDIIPDFGPFDSDVGVIII